MKSWKSWVVQLLWKQETNIKQYRFIALYNSIIITSDSFGRIHIQNISSLFHYVEGAFLVERYV